MTLQEQARALGDPTRHDIFRFVASAESPVGIAELTAHFGLNHNTIRQHLTKLVEAGLVTRSVAPTDRPGRPRLAFMVHPGADARWGASGPYARLGLLLVEMVGTGAGAVEVGRRAGSRLEVRGSSPIDSLSDAITRGGFEPSMRRGGSRVDFILRACPFAEVAEADPETVCGLHLGLAEGLAGQLDGVTVEELHRCDPRRAGCRLSFRLADHASPREVAPPRD